MKTRKITTRRRGITIVEVVVALAVIMLVSAATATFLLRVSEVEGEVAHTMARNEQVENVLECYQWANGDADDFTGAMVAVGYERNDNTLSFTLTESDYVEVTLEIDGDNLTGIVISGPSLDEDIIYGE